MNAYPDWNCEKCGREMTPHGDCYNCEKKERARAEAAGEIKRAKNIKVGDIINPRFSFKPRTIVVETVEITPKGKVVVNRGKGHFGGEEVFEGVQWVDVCKETKRDGGCLDDSCDLSHCAKCGSHMLGGHLEHGAVCDSCRMAEDQKATQLVVIIEDDHLVCRKLGNIIANVMEIGGEPTIVFAYGPFAPMLTAGECDIIWDNWNQMKEMSREQLHPHEEGELP